jgi:hypothetical protein
VWAGRIADLLSRFSPERIQVNFELYRERVQEQTIRKPGAWLCQAIVDGYALPSNSEALGSTVAGDSLPPLEHKQTLSEAKKDAYVNQGVGEDQFHRCLSPDSSSSKPQFMYFAPEVGGPEQRI